MEDIAVMNAGLTPVNSVKDSDILHYRKIIHFHNKTDSIIFLNPGLTELVERFFGLKRWVVQLCKADAGNTLERRDRTISVSHAKRFCDELEMLYPSLL